MRKVVYALISCLFCVIECRCTNLQTRLNTFKAQLNQWMQKDAGSDIYIITVSREVDNVCDVIQIDRLYAVLRAIDSLGDAVTQNASIVVFNEGFFGYSSPLTQQQFVDIQQIIEAYSIQHQHRLTYANFLKTDEQVFSRDEFANKVRQMKHALDNRRIVSKILTNEYINRLRDQYISDEQKIAVPVLSNITYCYFRGMPLTQYKKSSYCIEGERVLADSYNLMIYDIGDGIDHKCHVLYPYEGFRDWVLRNISSQICLDVGVNTRNVGNASGFMENVNGASSVMHIIQSNIIDIVEYHVTNNLPDGKVLVHVDPTTARADRYSLSRIRDVCVVDRQLNDVCGITRLGMRYVDCGDEKFRITLFRI